MVIGIIGIIAYAIGIPGFYFYQIMKSRKILELMEKDTLENKG